MSTQHTHCTDRLLIQFSSSTDNHLLTNVVSSPIYTMFSLSCVTLLDLKMISATQAIMKSPDKIR